MTLDLLQRHVELTNLDRSAFLLNLASGYHRLSAAEREKAEREQKGEIVFEDDDCFAPFRRYKEYRDRVQRKVMALLQYNPTLAALARGQPVSDLELLELEQVLRQELGAPDIQLTSGNIHRAYAVRVGCLIEFLRKLLEMEDIPDYADIVRRQFQTFIAAHSFNANQILFLRTLQSVLGQKHRVTWADLSAQPFTNLGADAIGRWFTFDQADEIMAFAETLAIGG